MSDEYDPFDSDQDLVPLNDRQAAQIREIAINGVEALQQTARQLQENSAHMGRWILASLLAMNSGGAVGLLSASDKVVGSIGAPLIAFGVGAALAVATGINGLITGMRVGPILGDSIEKLRLSVFENTIHASTKQKIRSMGPVLTQQLIVSACLAGGSLVAFAAGLYLAVT